MTAPRQHHRGMIATLAAVRAGCLCDVCRALRVRIIGAARRDLRRQIDAMARTVVTDGPQSDDPRERWDMTSVEVGS